MPTIEDQAATWMVLRAGRRLTAEEQREFDAWYAADIRHQGAYLRAVAVNQALDRATVQSNLRPSTTVVGPVWPARRRLHRFVVLGGMAAMMAVAAGTFLFPRPDRGVDLATNLGEVRQFPLADKSLASLNSASAIAFRQTDTTRDVELERGEAWFQVAKDKRKPFVVAAGEVRVRAVGTAFSVRREEKGAEVLVTEGVVEVWTNKGGGRRVLLSRGEQAWVPEAAGDIQAAAKPDEVERKLAWRRGRIVFTNQRLAEAVADFNRYTRRKIVIVDPAIQDMPFTGQYSADAPEVFAKDVSTYLDVPLSITVDTIRIGKAPSRGKG